MNIEINEIAVIGSGPAGLTAAIYAARAGHKVTIFAGDVPFGQLMNTTEVENYPGHVSIHGTNLMHNMKDQAESCGATFIQRQIIDLKVEKNNFKLKLSDDEFFHAKVCIVATGSSPKWLNLASEEEFKGYGISSCAVCDGSFHKQKEVCVIGGGNTAVEEAIYLSNIASKVTLIHRRDALRADQIMQDRLLQKANVEILWDSEVKEFYGDLNEKKLQYVLVENNKTKELTKLEVSGAFIAIGNNPQNDLLKSLIDLNENGYVDTSVFPAPMTSISGLFVAGDIADFVYRQAVTAAGDGCKAAMEASKFLELKLKSGIVKKIQNTENLDSNIFADRPDRRSGDGQRRSSGDSMEFRPRRDSDRRESSGSRDSSPFRRKFDDNKDRSEGFSPRRFGDRDNSERKFDGERRERPAFDGGFRSERRERFGSNETRGGSGRFDEPKNDANRSFDADSTKTSNEERPEGSAPRSFGDRGNSERKFDGERREFSRPRSPSPFPRRSFGDRNSAPRSFGDRNSTPRSFSGERRERPARFDGDSRSDRRNEQFGPSRSFGSAPKSFSGERSSSRPFERSSRPFDRSSSRPFNRSEGGVRRFNKPRDR